MILLDTDHLSVLRFRTGERCRRLTDRLEKRADEVIGTTIVNVWEQLKGWLANINKEKLAIRQVAGFRELGRVLEFYSDYHIAPFDLPAADLFDTFRKTKIRVGSSDLKIAAVAVTQGAMLLTANERDFRDVPGLRFENWLD